MTLPLDATCDPALQSWVREADDPASPFPIQNLPFGVFRTPGEGPRIGVAIGDRVLDLARVIDRGFAEGLPKDIVQALQSPRLNELMALGRGPMRVLRRHLSHLLSKGDPLGAASAELTHRQDAVTMLVPAAIGDYTDFYASVHHATNVGRLFRPDQPLLPNYKHIPIGYHGRASSIVIDGTPIHRPRGQRKGPDDAAPSFEPSRGLDYELEVGFFVGPGNRMGQPIALEHAEESIFGFCLVNDWSARDIQAWEYQPLGPFLAKNFATTVSPWVVTMDALEPFRAPIEPRPADDPKPLPYLQNARDAALGGIDISLEVLLQTPGLRAANKPPHRLSKVNFRSMYWTPGQMLAHHASNGCPMCPGDLLASGTVSGPDEGSQGCLLELTRRGAQPVALEDGTTRSFLQDGDELILRGTCERPGLRRIGFGTCRGVILPAL